MRELPHARVDLAHLPVGAGAEVQAAKEAIKAQHVVARIEDLGGAALADDAGQQHLEAAIGPVAIADAAIEVGLGLRVDVRDAVLVPLDQDLAFPRQGPCAPDAKDSLHAPSVSRPCRRHYEQGSAACEVATR